MSNEVGSTFWVNGVVAVRNGKPYLQLSNEKGLIAQLTMGQARKIAIDMLVMSARTEMDAMIHSFCKAQDFPDQTAGHMMAFFRDYRAEVDQEIIEGKEEE